MGCDGWYATVDGDQATGSKDSANKIVVHASQTKLKTK
jgi:hypothetical protein